MIQAGGETKDNLDITILYNKMIKDDNLHDVFA